MYIHSYLTEILVKYAAQEKYKILQNKFKPPLLLPYPFPHNNKLVISQYADFLQTTASRYIDIDAEFPYPNPLKFEPYGNWGAVNVTRFKLKFKHKPKIYKINDQVYNCFDNEKIWLKEQHFMIKIATLHPHIFIYVSSITHTHTPEQVKNTFHSDDINFETKVLIPHANASVINNVKIECNSTFKSVGCLDIINLALNKNGIYCNRKCKNEIKAFPMILDTKVLKITDEFSMWIEVENPDCIILEAIITK